MKVAGGRVFVRVRPHACSFARISSRTSCVGQRATGADEFALSPGFSSEAVLFPATRSSSTLAFGGFGWGIMLYILW